MRFPKPLVYLGFLLLGIAIIGSIFEAVFKEKPQERETVVSRRELAAGLIVDKLFEKLKSDLANEGLEVKDAILEELKKNHKTVYVNKYVYIAEELDRKKHTEKESQQINEDFNKNTLEGLKGIYKRKLSAISAE